MENNEFNGYETNPQDNNQTINQTNPASNMTNETENNNTTHQTESYSTYYSNVSNSDNGPLKDSSFYTENYKKPVKKKIGNLSQLVLVAVISSVLGGFVVGAFFYFVTPLLQPSVQSYFDKVIPESSRTSSQSNNGIYKKVEIEKSETPVAAIAEKVSPSIVGIRVTAKVQDFFFGEQQVGGEGSGIIIKENGYILTNWHVVQNALDSKNGAKIEVVLPSQKDKPYTAEVVGSDYRTDLAVLKINATGLPAAELGDSDKLKVGELAVAIGNPGGLEYMGSVSVGIVSGLNRTIPLEGIKDLKLIQTDAAINPGNSGGALVNSEGKIIGVNNAKMGGEGFEGLGFAIPINKAKEVADSLMEYKYVKRPMLGITVDTEFNEAAAKQYNVPAGVLVQDVNPMSGAYKAGIQRGDIITKFNGVAVKTFDELNAEKDKCKIGDTATLEVYRQGDDGKGKTEQVQVRLTDQPTQTETK